jgi:hypothetical protein
MGQSWEFELGGIHLVNKTQGPVAGGDVRTWHGTPFGIMDGWTPNVAKPSTLWQGGGPLINGSRPVVSSYDNVDEAIPFAVVGRDADEVADALNALRQALSGASPRTPIVWRHRPYGATNDLYAEVYAGWVQEGTHEGPGPIEGGRDLEGTINLTRSPFFGAGELVALLDGEAVTNGGSGNVFALGDLFGDLQIEGEPLNLSFAKPATGAAERLILGSVASRSNRAIGGSVAGVTSTTSGSAFSASGAVDVSALRSDRGLSVRTLGRFTTLTSPAKAEAQAEIQTSGGATLWVSSWVGLGSNTTAQLVDFGSAPLDMLRLPLASTVAANVKVVVRLRSTDGTAVSATLDYVDVLLAYDVCVVVSSGLASGERLLLAGAQNLAGGGWLPMLVEGAIVLDGSDIATKPARIHGQLPRAFTGCSLFVAWVGSDGGHSSADTSTISADLAPLWRSLRGIL